VMVLLGYDPAAAPDRIEVTTGSGIEFCARLSVQRIEAVERYWRRFLSSATRCLPVHKLTDYWG
jgi:hypothetical protein